MYIYKYICIIHKSIQIHIQFTIYSEPPLLGPGVFPPYGPPEYHQTGVDVNATNTNAGNGGNVGSGGTVQQGWKPATVHPGGLMKEPPTGGRNGPANFVAQGQQQGAVMMVYGLDNETSNTDKLFNLICLYGNVARVSGSNEHFVCVFAAFAAIQFRFEIMREKKIKLNAQF